MRSDGISGREPSQIIDYKGLVGDTSDNIPGRAGIGDKTAISLLDQYPTLEDIYAHLDDIAARFRNKLEAGREAAFLSRDLATIRTESGNHPRSGTGPHRPYEF